MVGTLQLVFPQCSKMELPVVHVFKCVDILFFFLHSLLFLYCNFIVIVSFYLAD